MVKKKKALKIKTSTTSQKHKKISHPRTPSRPTNILSAVKHKVTEALTPPERVEVHFVKKTLGKAPEEYHFVLHDGRRLKSLYELVDELETMSEDAFKDYVTDFKNDFANWTRDVFHAPELADELFRVKTKFDTQRAVMKHLLRDVQHLIKENVDQKTHEVHHTRQEKREHERLLGHKHLGKGGRCYIT